MGEVARGALGRAACSVVAAAATMLSGPSMAEAARPDAGPTPLGFTATATCPSSDEVSRIADERALASALRRSDDVPADQQGFVGTMAVFVVATTPSSAVVLCDPESAAAGLALGPFGGTVLGRSGRDAARPGLRALVAAPHEPGSSLTIGDQLELPEASRASSIDVAVRLGQATTHARLGPFPAPPRRVSILPHASGAAVRVALQDGAMVEQVLATPDVERSTLRARGAGARLLVRGRTTPGSAIVIDHPRPRDGGEQPFLAALDGTATAAANGRFRARTAPLVPGQRIATVDAFSLSTGSSASWRCRLRWRADRIASARCRARPATTAAAAASLAAGRPSPRSAADGSAARAVAAPRGVPGRISVIGRVPWLATPEGEQDVSLADLTGDGRPELLTAGYAGDHALWVSRAPGWLRLGLREDTWSDPIRLVDDVTGDGLGELWTSRGRGISGRATWSTQGGPPLDLRSTVSLGAGDLELPAEQDAFEPAPPLGLPDRTGDGRPELLIGDAAFSSAAFPLGQRTRAPLTWPGELTASIEAVAAAATGRAAALTPGPFGRALLTSAGTAPLAISTVLRRTTTGWATDLEARTIDGTSWGNPPLRWTATMTGIARIVGGNVATGDVLVRSATCRGARCTEHLHRLDGAGSPVGSSLPLVEDDEAFAAVVVADGSDADDRPEVVVRSGSTGLLRLWRSGDLSATTGALPVVLSGDAALRTVGPIVSWGPGGRPGGLVAFEPVARGDGVRALWVEAD